MGLQDKPDCLVLLPKSGLSGPPEKKSTRIRVIPTIVQIAQRTDSTMEELLKKFFSGRQRGMLSIIGILEGRIRIELPALGNKTSHKEEASDV